MTPINPMVRKADDPKVVAVVVTYNPNAEELRRLLDALAGERSLEIVVVDNGSEIDLGPAIADFNPSIHLIENGVNLGVAEGQNRGIAWARSNAADYVMLFDQDSLPDPDMIAILINFAEEQQLAGKKLGAVGPTNVDARWNKALPFVVIRNAAYRRVLCTPDQEYIEVDHVISSGCLISIDTLETVGVMRAELFIDYIDIEWCLRAKAAGFPIVGLRDAKMIHSLGNSVVNIGRKQLSMHSPNRDYYLFRNAIWMLRQHGIPLSWKIAEGKRLILRFAIYAVFGRPWMLQLKCMLRGILDGLAGKTGAR